MPRQPKISTTSRAGTEVLPLTSRMLCHRATDCTVAGREAHVQVYFITL